MTEIVLQVNQSAGDGVEYTSGTVDPTAATIRLAEANEWHGWLFPDLDIPPGSTINSAVMRVYNNSPYVVVKGTFRVEANNSPAVITSTSTDISSRTYEATTVSADETTGDGFSNLSADFSPLVQAIVDRSGYTQGQDMFVAIQGATGISWQLRGYDSAIVRGAKLTIDYTAGGIAPLAAAYYQQLRA